MIPLYGKYLELCLETFLAWQWCGIIGSRSCKFTSLTDLVAIKITPVHVRQYKVSNPEAT